MALNTVAGRLGRPWVVAAVLLMIGVGSSVWRSGHLAPGLRELGYLDRVERAIPVVQMMGRDGPGALATRKGHEAVARIGSAGALSAMVSAWLTLVVEQMGQERSLTAMRSFGLLVGGLGPAALFLLLRPAGLRVAAAAAVFLLLTPRWAHAVVTGRATLAGLWLLCLVCYVYVLAAQRGRGREPTARRADLRMLLWAQLSGVAFGLAVAHSLASLWVIPMLVVHRAWLDGRRPCVGLRRGWLQVPAPLLMGAPLAVVVALAVHPRLWRGGAVDAARWVFSPLRL